MLLLKKLLPAVAAACLLLLYATAASAHEHRTVHGYTFVVGFIQEPAFEGLLNAVSVRITKSPDSEGHGMTAESASEETKEEDKSGGMSMSMSGHGHGGAAVEGLESTLVVEVTHVPSGIGREMPLAIVRDDPGHYTAYFIPTATGQYTFRFIGTIEGTQIDETFESGPGRFADIEPATPLQFPESAASGRELESAVRGALESAQSAEDHALNAIDDANSVREEASAANTLAIAGIAVGALGIIVGAVGLVAALRRRTQ